MNQENALKVLISAVEIGQKAGAYSLKDAAVIAQAVALFTQPKVEKPLPTKKKTPMEPTEEIVEAPVEVVETQEEVTDAAPESTEEVVA